MTAPISADEARRLREAATPGPWKFAFTGKRGDEGICFDFALIAAAPDLAAEVERLSADNERLRAVVRALLANKYHEHNTYTYVYVDGANGSVPHRVPCRRCASEDAAATALSDEGEK